MQDIYYHATDTVTIDDWDYMKEIFEDVAIIFELPDRIPRPLPDE